MISRGDVTFSQSVVGGPASQSGSFRERVCVYNNAESLIILQLEVWLLYIIDLYIYIYIGEGSGFSNYSIIM